MNKLWEKFSNWLSGLVDVSWWKKLIVIVAFMAVSFGISFFICWALKQFIWVIAVLISIGTGIFIYTKIKGKNNG
jgi:hypothetical protein